ncbi:hypothetical protein SRHO_G00171840 [Serrasalmus rhombeus]
MEAQEVGIWNAWGEGKPTKTYFKVSEEEISPALNSISSKACASLIIRDEWRAYRGVLTQLGYRHFTVNHSRWFVDPASGAHTQHLKRAWLTYKSTMWQMRGNRTEKLLKEHLK